MQQKNSVMYIAAIYLIYVILCRKSYLDRMNFWLDRYILYCNVFIVFQNYNSMNAL